MKIVLDKCLLVDATLITLFKAFLNGAFRVATDILNEYAEKLEEKYILRPHVAENTLKAIENSPDVVYVSKYFYWNLITVDPDDNKFVDCAVAANADFIVTDDRHFNVLKDIPFPSVRVVSADDFVEMLTGVRPAKS